MITSKHIPMENTLNTRDLGGMVTADGRTVRFGKLLRSGNLSMLTGDGIKTLQDCGLCHVVDFRTAQEKGDRPDVVMDGVVYDWIPIFGQRVLGITREDGSEMNMRDLIQQGMRENPDGGRAYMASLYTIMAEDPYSKSQFAKFLHTVVQERDGALLWHCSAGKDRVGVATMYILTILGVPWETVLADFLMTNVYTRPNQIRIMQESLGEGEVDETVRANFEAMLTVDETYLTAAKDAMERIGGSMLGYLQQELGVTDEMIARMQELYLE